MRRSSAIVAIVSRLAALSLGALALGALTGAAAQAAPLTPPFATLTIGDSTPIVLTLTADPTKSGRYFVDDFVSADSYEITVTATLDGDPSILFGLNASNFGADPLSIVLAMAVPVFPITGPTEAVTSIRGTVNAGPQAPGGVDLSPLGVIDSDHDGIDEILLNRFDAAPLGIDVGPRTLSPGLYGPFTSGPIAGPSGPLFTFLQTSLAFRLSGGGDVADLQGFTQVQAVPEPASLSLVGLGLVALAKRLRDRRRHYDVC